MSDSSARPGAEPEIPVSKTFAEVTKEIARRNEEAHQAARKQREVSGRRARAEIRARDLR